MKRRGVACVRFKAQNMKKLDAETRNRLRVLWVLLNVSTEIETTNQSYEVMRAIEKLDKQAMKMWGEGFQVISNGKTLYEWLGV